MKVWLDDLRPMPEGFDRHVFSAKEAIALIETRRVTFISLDHDLGDSDAHGTGYDVALFIEAAAFTGKLPRLGWAVHSGNVIGAKNMRTALESANRYWDEMDELYKTAAEARKKNADEKKRKP